MKKPTFYLIVATVFFVFVACLRASGWLSLLHKAGAATVEISSMNLGALERGTEHHFFSSIKNSSTQPISVVGSQSCCGLTFVSLPKQVEPLSSAMIQASVFVPLANGPVHWEAVVYVSQEKMFPIRFAVSGLVNSPHAPQKVGADLGPSVLAD